MIVLEGTDAVGKTVTIEGLMKYRIQDRDNNISRFIDFNYSLEERARKIFNYLKDKDEVVIILINNDRDELERRVYKRKVVDEYDKLTYLYNLLYLETYEYMKQFNLLNDKIYLVDVTNLSLEQQIEEVRKVCDINAKYVCSHGCC